MFKIIKVIIIFVVSMTVFSFLEYETSLNKIHTLIQPLFFSITLSICLVWPSFRKIFIFCALIFLTIMIFTYLLNILDIAEWVGSLGFGMLVITLISFSGDFIKKGYIERL